MKKLSLLIIIMAIFIVPSAWGEDVKPVRGTQVITGDLYVGGTIHNDTLDAAIAAGGGSGDVATDAIWDAAGDTVYGTGANTAAKLAKGTAYQLYMMNSGATAPAWTSTIGVTGTRLTAGYFTNIYGTAMTTGVASTTAGTLNFLNATNANAFTITSGVSGAAIGWTLPTAAPGGANYLLNVDADGTMGYTDPSTLGGGATTITVSAHTATGDIANTETVIGTRVTNTGATGTITLTLPQCSTTHYPVAVYLTEAQAVVLTPYSGDQFMVLTSAADKTLTSGATAGSFIAFECLASGKWYPTGLNGAWTSN